MRGTVAQVNLSRNSGLGREIERISSKRAAKLLQQVTDDAVAEANKIVNLELVTDRNPNRRKRGNRHIEGSFTATVNWDGQHFPVELTLKSSAAKAKVQALEEGAPAHSIAARNAEWLFFPSTKGVATEVGRGGSIVRLESGARASSRARRQGHFRGSGKVKTHEVWHPGNRPYRFMQRAVDRAVRTALARFR